MVREGLKCHARLRAEDWEVMGPVCTAKDFLSGVAAKSMDRRRTSSPADSIGNPHGTIPWGAGGDIAGLIGHDG